jgi:hypothetical protein
MESQSAVHRLIGMVRSPRATLSAAIARPRSFDLAVLIVTVSTVCSVSFLMTGVGRLAALDQLVRQLESLGTVVDDQLYARLRDWERYRPVLSALGIIVGWPVLWIGGAALIKAIGAVGVAAAGSIEAIGNRPGRAQATFAQVLTVLVHASSVLVLGAIVALPIDYLRESLGGATSLATMLPGVGNGSFAGRLFGAIDVFVLWWAVLAALGLGMLYQTRTMTIARWLLGAYATGAAALALTQSLRGGV